MKKFVILTFLLSGYLQAAVSNQGASPQYFSPNSDGLKDTTFLQYDVDTSLMCSMSVYRSTGVKECVKNILTFAGRTPSGNPNPETWDGTDAGGSLLLDGTYFFKVSGSNLNFSYEDTIGNSNNNDLNLRNWFYNTYGIAASSDIIVVTSYSNGYVQRLDPASQDALWTRTGVSLAYGVCVDTTHAWVTRYNQRRIAKIRLSDGNVDATFYNASWGTQLRGIEKCEIDGKEYLLFTDSANKRIWAITPSTGGAANIFSGNNYFSSGTNPRDVAVDSTGNIYVCRNDRITRFNPDGTGGTDIITGLQEALSMEIKNDCIYVAEGGRAWGKFDDNYGHCIRKFDLNGNPSNIGSDNILGKKPGGPNNGWTENPAPYEKDRFWYPFGVAVNESGDIFVTDNFNYRVARFSSNGSFKNGWRSLLFPRGITTVNGDIFVMRDCALQIYSSTGSLKYHLQGYGANNSGQDSGWNYGSDVAVDSDGSMFIACHYYKIGVGWRWGVLKLDCTGDYIAHVEISHQSGAGICIDEGRNAVYLADDLTESGTSGVWKMDLNLNNPELVITNLDRPRGIAIDNDGNLYVSEYNDHQVHKFFKLENGTWKKVWQRGKPNDAWGSGYGEFYYPWGIDVIDNYVFVAEWSNARIQVLSTDGLILGRFGSLGNTNTQFNRPLDIKAVKEGDDCYIYVTDFYNYRIQKIKVGNLTDVSFAQADVMIDTTEPTVPTGLSILNEGSGERLNLSWSPSEDSLSGVAGYNIYRSTFPGGYSIVVATYNPTSFQDTGLTEGVTYHYVLKAVDFADNQSVDSSSGSKCSENTAPSAPVGVYASGAGSGKIDISWLPNPESDVTGYYVHRSSGYDYYSKSSLISGTSHQDTGIADGTTYYYKITAWDGLYEGAESDEVSATTWDDTKPADTTDLSALRMNEPGKIKLLWTAPGDDGTVGVASQYDIRYGTYPLTADNFGNFPSISEKSPHPSPSSSGTQEQMIVTGLTSGATFYFALKTADEGPNGSNISNVILIQTPAAPQISLLSFNDGKTYGDDEGASGNAMNEIKWSYSDLNADNTHYFYVRVSSDSGITWRELEDENGYIVGDLPDGTTFYLWDTRQFQDGTKFRLKIAITDSDGLSGISSSTVDFAIRNQNVPPIVEIVSPDGGETWSGSRTIRWNTTDKNRTDTHTFEIYISTDGGNSDGSIHDATVFSSSATWDTTKYSDGTKYRIKVVAGDGKAQGEDSSSNNFAIFNENQAPGEFSLSSPEDGKYINTLSPTLFWETSVDPDGNDVTYKLYLSSYSGSNFVEVSSTTEAQYSFEFDLTDGVSYWWLVKATDGSIEVPSRETYVFEIDVTSPALVSATLKDANENGKINRITLVFSENIDDYSLNVSTFILAGIPGSSFDTGAQSNDSIVDIILSEEVSGTGTHELLIGEGAAGDLAGNVLPSTTPVVTDGAAPVIFSAFTQDRNLNGIVDKVKIIFSEKIKDSSVRYSDFKLEGISGINFVSDAADDEIIYIDFSETELDAESTPVLKYTAGTLTDHSGLFLRSTQTVTQDGVPPAVPEVSPESEFTKGTSNTISWSDGSPSGALSYLVECSTESDFSSIFSISGWISELSHEFSPLEERKHYYRIKAKDSAGNESAFSSYVCSTQDNTPPLPVTTLEAKSLTAGDISLEWEVPADAGSGLSCYGIYRSSVTNFVFISSATLTHYTDYFENALVDGVTFYYQIYPVDSVGNIQKSEENNISSAVCKEEGPRTPQLEPEPAYTGGTSNTLCWEATSGAESYLLQIAENENFTEGLKENNWINTTYYTFTALEDGKKYFYRIMAKDGLDNKSSWSFAVYSTQDDTPPEKVTGLSASTGPHQGEVKISFTSPEDDVSELGSYAVKYATFSFSGAQWDEIQEFIHTWQPLPSGEGEEKIISGLQARTSYWFAIKSVDSVGNVSLISNVAGSGTFTPPSVTVSSPVGSASLAGPTKIQWSYSDPNELDEIRFKILLSSDNFETSYLIASTEALSNTTSYIWDSRKYYNGSGYRIKIVAYDPANLQGEDISDGGFTIANANDPPVVHVSYPNGGETVGGNVNVRWNAFDYNAFDALSFEVSVSADAGMNWELIGKTTSYYYLWRSTSSDDGNYFLIKVLAKDDGATTGQAPKEASDISDSYFTVSNINLAPYDFELLSPATTANSLTPVLKWEAKGDPNPGDVVSYKVWVSTYSDFSKIVLLEGEISGNYYKFPPENKLNDLATYYWKVMAQDSSETPAIKYGKSGSYYYSSFRVEDEVPQVSTTTPRNGEKLYLAEIPAVKIYFNKRMSEENFSGNIEVKDGNQVLTVNTIYDDDEMSLTLDFTLEPSHRYTIKTDKTITDLIGRGMEKDFEFSFTTLLEEAQPNVVKSPDGLLEIEISSGTLSLGSYVIIRAVTEEDEKYFRVDAANLKTKSVVNIKEISELSYDIVACDGSGAEVSPQKEVKLSFKYTPDEQNPDYVKGTRTKVDFLRIFRLDEEKNRWNLVRGSNVDRENNSVWVMLGSFSVYSVFAYAEPDEVLSNVYNFPNPFSPQQKTAICYILTEDCKVTVRIFNLFGDLVKKMEFEKGADPGGKGQTGGYDNRISWDGRNDYGMKVANGLYICEVRAENGNGTHRKVRKIGVLK